MATQSSSNYFGYETVTDTEKSARVNAVFSRVAHGYDLMNDLMSFGVHRLWKRYTCMQARVRSGQRILDVAGGTGDLAALLAPKAGEQGEVIIADRNRDMLRQGRDRLLNQGLINNISLVQMDAEQLSFQDDYFDRVLIAFGLRNVTHIEQALSAMYRVLKPGGMLLVLEFSKPVLPGLQALYDCYSFQVLPKLGQWIVGDASSYQYLVESIRMFPDQQQLLERMQQAGLEDCHYENLTGGIVALHKGYKY